MKPIISMAISAGIVLAASQSQAHDMSLPLGDGHVSSTPRVGYVMACRTQFRPGRGARHAGDWIQGNVWYPSKKVSVEGKTYWKGDSFHQKIDVKDGKKIRVIRMESVPDVGFTGNFPISPSDPAYQYDRNPNRVIPHWITLDLPENPKIAAHASCTPMGMIGVALNGVAIFNALDDSGRDAVAHETQDACDGHPQMNGEYHYHGPSRCMPNVDAREKLVGYALDGFGIYSLKDKNGHEATDKDLDACHGVTSTVMWNGKPTRIYHYVLTREYPYTIGCFRGDPVGVDQARAQINRSGLSHRAMMRRRGMGGGPLRFGPPSREGQDAFPRP